MDKLGEYSDAMENYYRKVRPKFDSLDEKINTSEFYDVIESKAEIWKMNESFKAIQG